MTTHEVITDDLMGRRAQHGSELDEVLAATEPREEFTGFGDPTSLLPLAVVTSGADEHEAEWHDRALCAQTDPEAFFPEKGGSTREAKKICTGCEVRAECLTYALAHDERFGIWGGMSERERRRLKRRVV